MSIFQKLLGNFSVIFLSKSVTFGISESQKIPKKYSINYLRNTAKYPKIPSILPVITDHVKKVTRYFIDNLSVIIFFLPGIFEYFFCDHVGYMSGYDI